MPSPRTPNACNIAGVAPMKSAETHEREPIMNLLNIFKSFKNDEAGAVTVDWVVLTAAVVGLGAVIGITIMPGITTAGGKIVTKLGANTN
jgi:hypothetical protein